MNVALVGTGFVADYYELTLVNHPLLRLAGAFDAEPPVLERFTDFHGVRAYGSLEELLGDPTVDIVVNLTPPQLHYEVCSRALAAGKHVYCEQPLAMSFDAAAELVAMARSRGLTLVTAPANALSPAHQAVAAALAAGEIGQPRLAYAEIRDGPVFRQRWQQWRSRCGAPWNGDRSFQVGLPLERAGYALSWIVSLFGPARSVIAFSALTFPDKGQSDEVRLGPDLAVGILEFDGGVVVHLTSGYSARRDRSLTLLGDSGTLIVDDVCDHTSPVRLGRADDSLRWSDRLARGISRRLGHWIAYRPVPGRALTLPRQSTVVLPEYPARMDFTAGVAVQAESIVTGAVPFFSGDVTLHLVELAIALSNAGSAGGLYLPRSSFDLEQARRQSEIRPAAVAD